MAADIKGVPFKLSAADMGGLGGFDLGAAIRSGLENANLYQEAKYKPQSLANKNYSEQLLNKINEAKAKYAAEKELANLKYTQAGTGNLGAQEALHRGQLGLLPFEKQLRIAQAQQAIANAQKSGVLGNLYNSVMNGGLVGGNSQGMQNNYADKLQNKAGNGSPQQGGMDRANLVAGLLHLPVSNQVVNGQLITNNPLTGISSTKVGPSAEETAFATGMGKGKAEEYNNAVNIYNGLQNQGLALDELANAAENNPDFRNVTGRINQPLTNWFGTPEQQQLLGQLQSSSGEIALQVAPSLKGAFTGRDQALINSIKASPNDFPDVFIGKLKAQKLINDVLSERSRLKAEYLEQNKSSLEASRLAVKDTPLDKFKPQVDALIKRREPLTADQLQLAKAELAKRRGAQ